MAEAIGNAFQVADAITVGVLIGAWINLVDNGTAPPILVRCQSGRNFVGHYGVLSGMGIHEGISLP
ncbi:hypothetical protein D3C87_2110050 [compost metagenome]